MLTVPVRLVTSGLALTRKFTAVLPAPFVAEVMLIHGFVFTSVQAQTSLLATRLTEPLLPTSEKFAAVESRENPQFKTTAMLEPA